MHTVAIDASRNRSGGAKVHLVGILTELIPEEFGIKEVHVWSYPELLDILPERDWLIKHSPKQLKKSIFTQIFWQKFLFSGELKRHNCSVILNTDAGTVGRFQPSVTMSRDMLSYEPKEIDRYKYGLSWIRLILLRYMQNSSLRSASAVIFLTNYASKMIQTSCGELEEFRVIPHGVSNIFRNQINLTKWPDNKSEVLNILYVSNTAPYKHQWEVIRAIHILRQEGWNIKLTLAGAEGQSHHLVNKAIKEFNGHEFVILLGHVPNKKLPKLLASSNLFVFASSCENMPNTLVEAMSVGLPIACSNRGPMPEVLGDGGVYFNPESTDSIALSIRKIMNDKLLRGNISGKAKVKSTNYSWKKCSNETFSYLVETIENGNLNE